MMSGGRPRKVRVGPKKPLNAYTLFVVEVRNLVSKENPDMPFKEVATKVGQMWRELPEHHRQKYQELAEQDKSRYLREKEEWRMRALEAPPEDIVGKKKKRKGAPKNPLSAYTYYIMDVRKEVALKYPELSFREVAVRCGMMWRNLGDEERKGYMKKAEQDKTRYENEMIDWNAKLQVEAAEEAMGTKKNKKKRNLPKNPLSAYTYFVMEMRPKVSLENPRMSFGDVATQVGNMWRELSAEQRMKYENRAREDKERYEREKQSIQETMASLNQDALMGYHLQQHGAANQQYNMHYTMPLPMGGHYGL